VIHSRPLSVSALHVDPQRDRVRRVQHLKLPPASGVRIPERAGRIERHPFTATPNSHMLSGVGLSAAIGSSGISSRCFCARIGIESRHIGPHRRGGLPIAADLTQLPHFLDRVLIPCGLAGAFSDYFGPIA